MGLNTGCLRYCKSTSFQANHNCLVIGFTSPYVVCDTAKVRVFKQITTLSESELKKIGCLRYCKSTSFQANHNSILMSTWKMKVVCDTAKVRVFKQITTLLHKEVKRAVLFAILQKYEFSSKSQHFNTDSSTTASCLRYCKSTSFQANHNVRKERTPHVRVVCDTAKVRVFKQITTPRPSLSVHRRLFAILQKYEFSSKSQLINHIAKLLISCLRYCKSTSFQANHNCMCASRLRYSVVCDTAKVRVFKQITTISQPFLNTHCCLRYCKSTSFQANHNPYIGASNVHHVVCDTAKVRVFKQITTFGISNAIPLGCLRYCKSTSFQANHNPNFWLIQHLGVVCDTAKVRVFKQITTAPRLLRTIRELFAILQKYEFSSKSQR